MYARAAVTLLNALAAQYGMKPQPIFGGDILDCFDIVDQGSHKYIPADKLDEQLGIPPGAGIFGYVKFGDGSYVLRLCRGELAWWSGDINDPPEMNTEK